jgi:DNA-binding LytR/AlgR family response regulator
MVNESIKVLVLDDDKNSLRLSREAIGEFVLEEHIYCAENAIEAIRIMESKPINLAFIDIEMPDISGFSMAEYIKQSQSHIKYVFLTGHTDFGAESYDYEPFDFLTKPLNILRLKKTFERYENSCSSYSKERIAIETDAGFILISPSEINYIVKDKRDIKIICTNNRTYLVHYTLDNLEVVFGEYGFFRAHQSYIIPLSKIASVLPSIFGKTYEAVLSDGEHVPVSRSRYPKLREYLASNGIRFV